MAGAGLLIPIPNSGPRPPRRPRQAGDQQLTPRLAVPRSPGPAPRPPGRCLASGFARRMADRGRWRALRSPAVPQPADPGLCGDRETWLSLNRKMCATGRHRPPGLCLPGRLPASCWSGRRRWGRGRLGRPGRTWRRRPGRCRLVRRWRAQGRLGR